MTRSSQWRREPFVPLHYLQNELARLLEQYLQSENRVPASPAPTDIDQTGWSPLIDVYETAEETMVVAEIPGVDPASVDLSITGNLFVLRGVKDGGDLPEAQLQSRERRFGAFHRQVMLSNEVDFDAAQAEARNGVLTIRLPRRKSAMPRNIPIRPS